MSSRYTRQIRLPELGEEGQARLGRGSALIVGAGGLGSPVAIYLAAAGVGRIGLADFDRVDVTNLHRQILYTTSDVGRPKLEAAAEHLRDLNPDVDVVSHDVVLSSANALDVLRDYDVVIDGTDNFPARYLINDACTILGKPNVYGSIFRFEGQAAVFDARGGPCYRCLYPEPPPAHLVPSCAEAGVIGVLPGVIGTIQATEAVKLLAGIGETLLGRLLLFDALRMTFRTIRLKKNCAAHAQVTRLIDYEGFCNPMIEITAKEAAETLRDIVLVDVREPYEWSVGHVEGALHIPMQQVPARIDEIPRDRDVVVCCRVGGRSARVQQYLQQQGYTNVKNMTGGMLAWKRDVDPDVTVA
jgi:adenylyltransferase/sulfurtransferase